MNDLAGSTIYSSTNGSTSTLRPRNNRLISFLEDSNSDHETLSQSAFTSSSRGPSPSGAFTHSRTSAQTNERSSKQSQGAGILNENTERRSSSIWDPWSSIQGVASSFLGGSETSASALLARKGSIKTPVWMKQDVKTKTPAATTRWGPEGKSNTKTTPHSIEQRQVLVQAKKREALLQSYAEEGRDESGHFKRRASYDSDSHNATEHQDMNQDALVYRHDVQPHDTLAGVSIRYSCQAEAFRKVNRFWPNDNIQTRKFVLLPVDACSVRGRKVDDATSVELLANRLDQAGLDSKQKSVSSLGEQISALTELSQSASSTKKQNVEDQDWKHHSYVIIPSFNELVEILRIPRKTLGYFPRARRKSIQKVADSVDSTPKTSFDMLRHPPSHAAQQAAAASVVQHPLSLNASPVRRSHLEPASRQRSSSTASATNSSANNAWTLRGPGGVGNLRGLRTEISRPGPAEDPLNQKFAQYFPSLAAQADEDDSPTSTRSKTIPPARSPYRITPRASIDSVRSTRSNSSTFGVAGVENFMRKLATGGKRPDVPRTGSGNLVNVMGIPISSDSALGDLIEMETSPDALNNIQGRMGEDRTSRDISDWNDDNLTPTHAGKSQEEILNERFPIRGRITRAYGRDGSS